MYAAAAKSLQLYPTLCDPIDVSPPGSPVPGILQVRTLKWVAIPSPMHESEKWKWSRSVMSDSSQSYGLQPTRLLCPWDFPGKSTGVGCHCLLLICMYIHVYMYKILEMATYICTSQVCLKCPLCKETLIISLFDWFGSSQTPELSSLIVCCTAGWLNSSLLFLYKAFVAF